MELNLVLGAGQSGINMAKLLLEKGEAVLICDDHVSNIPEELKKYPLCIYYTRGLKLDLAQLKYKRVIKSPGLSNDLPLVKKLAADYFIYSDIEVAIEFEDNLTFCGITGSNGKTTVTTLLEFLGTPQIVSAGNIGTPLSEVVLKEHHKIVALELSSFQLEGIKSFKPKVATILNLSPDHLDRYERVDDYYNAKLNLVKNMDHNDIFIRNLDDEQVMRKTSELNMKIYDFSLQQKADIYCQDGVCYFLDSKLFDISSLKIKGNHNLSNAMVASTMALLLGIDILQIQSRLAQFKGVEHRLEYVMNIDGVDVYNDSKATNPEATEVALQAFDSNRIHLILGGYDKHVSFDGLKPYESKCAQIYAYGETKMIIKNLFKDAIVSDSLESTISKIKAQKGDIILFSPACASYDQFDNYEQRGKIFKELIKQIKNIV